ncbi:MAG: pantetheine-phosphate adenylyltransferase [Clostridia bacterium]|nr:pantetheine-phosphate adenylyltransferase [Clostridia bacterium]
MKYCVFPGSFDPPTKGHLDLIRRAAGMFDRVTVAVMVNVAKEGLIPWEERVRMLEKACRDIPNVRVVLWKGLLADFVKQQKKPAVVVRGVRNAAEYEHEAEAAAVNRMLCPGMETVLIPASDGMGMVSSSTVREIAAFGGDYDFLIPEEIQQDIGRYLKNKK